MKVHITSGDARTIKGTSATTGKAYAFRTQEAYFFGRDRAGNEQPYPVRFEVILDEDQAAYKPGNYTLDPSSVYVDRRGRLAVSPRLVPAPSTRAASMTA